MIEISQKKSSNEPGQTESGMGGLAGGGADKGGEGGAPSTSEATEITSMENIAVFKNGILVKTLTKEQSRGYVWTDQSSERGHVTLEHVVVNGSDIGIVTLTLKKKKFKLRTGFEEGKPQATLSVDLSMLYEDKHKIYGLQSEYGLSEDEINTIIEEAFGKIVKTEIESVFAEMQQLNCDLFHIAEDLYRFHNKEYKAFEDKHGITQHVTPQIEVRVNMH